MTAVLDELQELLLADGLAPVTAACYARTALRHTALATANDATRDLRAVQEFARHARPETTALYTRVTARRLMEVAMSIDYRTPPKEEPWP